MCEFLISENHFLISENHFLISEIIFWYQKMPRFSDIRNYFLIPEVIFWYQKLFSDIRKCHDFLISEIMFWYQKIISDIRKSNFWYQKIIGSDNRRQAIIWSNAGLLLIGLLGTNFSEILIEILTFSFQKMRLKMSSAKRRPFCLGLNVLKSYLAFHTPVTTKLASWKLPVFGVWSDSWSVFALLLPLILNNYPVVEQIKLITNRAELHTRISAMQPRLTRQNQNVFDHCRHLHNHACRHGYST